MKDNRVEWLAGITTGLTAVPTAVAFAILAGVSPSVGLRGTWIIMLIMSLFGGEGPINSGYWEKEVTGAAVFVCERSGVLADFFCCLGVWLHMGGVGVRRGMESYDAVFG